jgi:hypothetical protein
MPSKQSKFTTVNSNQTPINETDSNFNTSTSNTNSKIKPTANTELLDTNPSLNKLFNHLNKEPKTNQRTKHEIEKLAQYNTINERMTNKVQPQDSEKAINDSFDSIDKNQGSVYEEMKTVNRSKISTINIDITSLSNNISKIIAKLNQLDIKVTKIERNLQTYENQNDDIVEVKGKLAELESNTSVFEDTLFDLERKIKFNSKVTGKNTKSTQNETNGSKSKTTPKAKPNTSSKSKFLIKRLGTKKSNWKSLTQDEIDEEEEDELLNLSDHFKTKTSKSAIKPKPKNQK